MDFAPLRYALGTITIWHAVALFACIVVYAMPRVVGYGFTDFPKLAWGVHLYRAP